MGRRISNEWAKEYIAALRRGENVKFRPVGGSMSPIIESGQLVEVAPTANRKLKVGSVVLVQVRDFTYFHLIKAIEDDRRYLIGNNRGGTNGWVERSAIYGVLQPG